MLQQALRRGPPYPMVLTGPEDEYWVDGTEHDTPLDARGDPVLPQHTWKPKIECDETARCYRRHFLGKVSPRRVRPGQSGTGPCVEAGDSRRDLGAGRSRAGRMMSVLTSAYCIFLAEAHLS